MKKTLMMFCMLMAALAFCACENHERELVGKWKSYDPLYMDGDKFTYQMDLEFGGKSTWQLLFDDDIEMEGVKLHSKVSVTLTGTWETHGDILTSHIDETPLKYTVEEITCDDPEVNERMQQVLTPLVKTQIEEGLEKEMKEMVAKMRDVLNGDDKILDNKYLSIEDGFLMLDAGIGKPKRTFRKQ